MGRHHHRVGAALGLEGVAAGAPKVKFETKALISLSPGPLERPGRHINEKGNSVRKRAEGARIIGEERRSYIQGGLGHGPCLPKFSQALERLGLPVPGLHTPALQIQGLVAVQQSRLAVELGALLPAQTALNTPFQVTRDVILGFRG